MTTREFIYKALKGETRKEFCSSVVVYGDTVYSYGQHYPLAKIINGIGFINNRGYSNSTSKHIGWAWQAVSDIVGYENTYSVPLTDGDSLSPRGILSSATRELKRLTELMESKKRQDTMVYADLQNQAYKMVKVTEVVEGIK